MKSETNHHNCHSTKCIWKCRLQNEGHFVSASMCWLYWWPTVPGHQQTQSWPASPTRYFHRFFGYQLFPVCLNRSSDIIQNGRTDLPAIQGLIHHMKYTPRKHTDVLTTLWSCPSNRSQWRNVYNFTLSRRLKMLCTEGTSSQMWNLWKTSPQSKACVFEPSTQGFIRTLSQRWGCWVSPCWATWHGIHIKDGMNTIFLGFVFCFWHTYKTNSSGQDCGVSSASTLEIQQSCTKPSIQNNHSLFNRKWREFCSRSFKKYPKLYNLFHRLWSHHTKHTTRSCSPELIMWCVDAPQGGSIDRNSRRKGGIRSSGHDTPSGWKKYNYSWVNFLFQNTPQKYLIAHPYGSSAGNFSVRSSQNIAEILPVWMRYYGEVFFWAGSVTSK